VRDPPARQSDLRGRRVNEKPRGLPPRHGVDERLNGARSLGPGFGVRLVNPSKKHPIEVRFVPRILPVGHPKPNDVPDGVVGGPHLGKPLPKPPSRLAVEAFEQSGLPAEERVDGGGGGPDPSSQPPKAEGLNPTIEDKNGSVREQPPTKDVVVNLRPTHLDKPTVTVFRNVVTKGGDMQTLALSSASRYIAGAVLLTIVGIEFGGWFMTQIVRGKVAMTAFQKSFARAGHAHAGVLVTLSLVTLVLADATALDGVLGWLARIGTPAAAALISAGFFFSSMGRGEITRPNRLIGLIWLGALSLAVGVATLGVGLLTT
jgi:hypothetical protein